MPIDEAPRALYVDSSAIVKLIVPEAESDALRTHVEGAHLVTSEIALTEVPRAARLRTNAPDVFDRAEAVLRRFELVELDEELHRAAARRGPPTLRALDAIHLVSALRLGQRVRSVVAYDRRLVDAARAAGLAVDQPGVPSATDKEAAPPPQT